jgi:hypothetical protein
MDEVDLYPNPVRDYVVVGINEEVQGKLTIEITDKAGKPLFRQSWENADRAIQIELNDLNLAPGFYFVKIAQEGLATKTRRLFKR